MKKNVSFAALFLYNLVLITLHGRTVNISPSYSSTASALTHKPCDYCVFKGKCFVSLSFVILISNYFLRTVNLIDESIASIAFS